MQATIMNDDGRAVVKTFESELSFREHLDLQEWDLRKNLAKSIMNTFLWINGVVLILVIAIYIVDSMFLANKIIQSNERIIETKVIVSIIAATTIQLGAITVSLSRWLFPKE